ncbi:uncharacterized protein LOC133904895 [Phragmites australis]|uniref:uncharacterized protein LOC133904895 n=1 Tax=Phragmites australis TaxID=29695 RepID=UPI002D7A39FD|nr:uncharacterized protein LOC133904895 [Phragmites australis]XP_062202521.1 uncharacterized protein LOC133904895 [Phragmites australis]
MEGGDGPGFDSAPMKRRRSSGARRPRQDGGPAAEPRDNTSPSSSSMSPRSGSRRLLPLDENAAGPDGGLQRREFHLNAPSPERVTHGGNRLRSEAAGSSSRKSESSHGAHVSEGNRGSSSTGDKSRKLKLKISRNVLSKPNPDTSSDSRSSPAKPPRPGDSQHQQKHGNLTEGRKDPDRSTSSRDKKTRKERSIEETLAQEQPAKVQRELPSEPLRKSRRIAKKSILDSELDEDYDTSNLENLGTPEDMEGHNRGHKNKVESSSKKNASKRVKNMSKVYEVDNDFFTSRSSRDGKKRSRESTDGDNTEEEPTSDSELDAENKKQKPVNESPANVRSEPLTTRRRALQSWMDGSSNSTVEFPDGLPPAPSRSKKDKLSEEEMLAKKAEAAQRRKMQVEKTTKESEAEAIRKILGLDSDKKKEERKQKEREEKERATRAQNLAASSIRWVIGPTGTVVSFPDAVGLPSIFNSKPVSYPPPREKCAGPSCTNAYRYRDSKLNLPLCSLKCYKAVHEKA